MRPAHVGRSVSAATRVAAPGFSSSTSSRTSREPSRFCLATVTRRRAIRTAGPVELVSYTYRGRTLARPAPVSGLRSEEHTSELQSHHDLVCRLLLEKKKKNNR